jgi:hypothetical protein
VPGFAVGAEMDFRSMTPRTSGVTHMNLPDRFETVAALEDFMTTPPPELVADMKTLKGDILVLGVGGKMGRRWRAWPSGAPLGSA